MIGKSGQARWQRRWNNTHEACVLLNRCELKIFENWGERNGLGIARQSRGSNSKHKFQVRKASDGILAKSRQVKASDRKSEQELVEGRASDKLIDGLAVQAITYYLRFEINVGSSLGTVMTTTPKALEA